MNHRRDQSAYYRRRSGNQTQVLLWIDKTLLETIDALRGRVPRTTWINLAIKAAAREKLQPRKANNGTT